MLGIQPRRDTGYNIRHHGFSDKTEPCRPKSVVKHTEKVHACAGTVIEALSRRLSSVPCAGDKERRALAERRLVEHSRLLCAAGSLRASRIITAIRAKHIIIMLTDMGTFPSRAYSIVPLIQPQIGINLVTGALKN